jgi:hypothetical protein
MDLKQTQSKSLTVEQKAGFVLLLVFGILAISLGFLQMRNTIYNPFIVRLPNKGLGSQSFLNESVRLQNIDTDNDSLTDYDELEFYQTSPSLPDTDSDGIDDGVEIELGTDPLCSEGKSCDIELGPELEAEVGSPLLSDSSPLDLLDLIGQSAALADEESIDTTDQSGVDLNAIMNSPEMLRQLLLSSGQITEEQLSQIDDETILDLVEDIGLSL